MNIKQSTSNLIILFIVIGLAGSSITPFLVYSANLWNGQNVSYVGEPIASSVFSDYIGDDGASVVFPAAYEIRTDRPLIFETDYHEFLPQIMVVYAEALEIAENWLLRNGPPLVSWTLQSYSNTTSPPSWTFYFTHIDFYAYVTVDAVSGLVIEYESRYLHDYQPEILTLEESEDIVQSFLVAENITLPTTARYIKGEPYDCQRFYSLVFQEYVGPVKVEDSQVLVRASAFTRGISYYKYNWVGIDAVDLTGVLSTEIARMNSLSQIPEIGMLTDPVWTASELALSEIPSPEPEIDRTWRLSWVLHVEDASNPSYEAQIFLDAFSGNAFGFRSTETSYTQVIEHSSLYSTETLFTIGELSILMLGVVLIYTVYRWRTSLSRRQEFSPQPEQPLPQ